MALLFGCQLHAQKPEAGAFQSKSIFNTKFTRSLSRQGQWFAFYGYNFSWYTPSDVYFKGKGYDFKLRHVKAHDRPSKLSWDYLNPMEITTPQVNIRFGYHISDNYSISFGWDHMKYVMDIPQEVVICGHIGSEVSEPGIHTGRFAGTYNGQTMTIPAEMLTFEHTDGYNYVSAELERYDDIWLSKSQKNSLSLETGVGIGTIIPRTDAKFFGVGDNHYWNFAGYGASLKAGLKFHITKRFFLQNTAKIGWSRLNNIRTTGRSGIDKARQNISYLENYTVLGYQF